MGSCELLLHLWQKHKLYIQVQIDGNFNIIIIFKQLSLTECSLLPLPLLAAGLIALTAYSPSPHLSLSLQMMPALIPPPPPPPQGTSSPLAADSTWAVYPGT